MDPLSGLLDPNIFLQTLVSHLMMPHALAQLEAQNHAASKMQADAAAAAAAAIAAVQQQQALSLAPLLHQAAASQAAAAAAAAAAVQQASQSAAAYSQLQAQANGNKSIQSDSHASSSSASSSSSSSSSRAGANKSTSSSAGGAATSGSTSSSSYSAGNQSNNNSGNGPPGKSGPSRPCACKDCLAGKPPPPRNSSSSSNSTNNSSGANGSGTSSSDAPFGRSLSDTQNRLTNGNGNESSGNVTSIGVLKQMNQAAASSASSAVSNGSNTSSGRGSSSNRHTNARGKGAAAAAAAANSNYSAPSTASSAASTLPPALVQSTMAPPPSIGHINIHKLDNSTFDGSSSASPMLLPYTASPALAGAESNNVLSPAPGSRSLQSSAGSNDSGKPSHSLSNSNGGPPVFDAAAAMIVMSNSPPLHAVSPSLGAHIPSLDAFPPSLSSSSLSSSVHKSSSLHSHSLHSPALTSAAVSRSPHFHIHSPSASPTFNLPSPSLPPILTSGLDLRGLSQSPEANNRNLSNSTTNAPTATVAAPSQTSTSHSHTTSGSASLLLSTPSASYLRATPSSPSSLVFASFLKSPINANGGLPNAAGAAALAKDGNILGSTSASSVTSTSLLLNGSDVARGNKERETVISLNSIATGSASGGNSASAAQLAANSSTSTLSASSSSSTTTGVSGAGASHNPNMSILHRLKTINQSSTPSTSPSPSPNPTASPDAAANQRSMANSGTQSSAQNGGKKPVNWGPNTTYPPPSDQRKRPRDVYEGNGNPSGSPPSQQDCHNCAQCQAIAAQKAAAANGGPSIAAMQHSHHASSHATSYTPNPYPSTPFSSSTPHPTQSSSSHPASLLKSPLVPSFTPPIFPVSLSNSSLNMLMPGSNLLAAQPVSSARRDSLAAAMMTLSPALRPLTGSPMLTGRSSLLSQGSGSGALDKNGINTKIDGLDTSSPMSLSLSSSSPVPSSLLCHQCAQHRPLHTLLFCCNAYAKHGARSKQQKLCTNKYCESCLLNYYSIDKVGSKHSSITQFPPVGKRHGIHHNWECPECRGVCSCAVCRGTSLLPLSEVNPLTLSNVHSLAYAYVFMAEYLEDSMAKPPTDAEASEAAAAAGLANAATYAVATSPMIRPVKVEDGTSHSSGVKSIASINVCPLPTSMSILSSDDEEDDEQSTSRSTHLQVVDRKVALTKSPLLGAITPKLSVRADPLGTILAASRSPLLQSMSDSLVGDHANMPIVKLEGEMKRGKLDDNTSSAMIDVSMLPGRIGSSSSPPPLSTFLPLGGGMQAPAPSPLNLKTEHEESKSGHSNTNSMMDDVAIANAAVSGSSSAAESPLLLSSLSPQTAAAIAVAAQMEENESIGSSEHSSNAAPQRPQVIV